MTKPDPKLLAEWYKKVAQCPHKPQCRPLRSCDKAVPNDGDMSLFEKGVGGSDPDHRALSFVQLDGYGHGADGENVPQAELMFAESVATFGSANVADHPDAIVWRHFGQAAHALPSNYKGRRALIALSETGFIQKAAREAGITRFVLHGLLRKFCKDHGIDRSRLILRRQPLKA